MHIRLTVVYRVVAQLPQVAPSYILMHLDINAFVSYVNAVVFGIIQGVSISISMSLKSFTKVKLQIKFLNSVTHVNFDNILIFMNINI